MTRSGGSRGIERPLVGEQRHDRRSSPAGVARGARPSAGDREDQDRHVAGAGRVADRASSRSGRRRARRLGRPPRPPRQLGDQDRQRSDEPAGGQRRRTGRAGCRRAGRRPPPPGPAGRADGPRPRLDVDSQAIASRPATIQPASMRRRASARWTKASAPGPAGRREPPGHPAGQRPAPFGRPSAAAATRGEVSPRQCSTDWNRSVRSEPQASGLADRVEPRAPPLESGPLGLRGDQQGLGHRTIARPCCWSSARPDPGDRPPDRPGKHDDFGPSPAEAQRQPIDDDRPGCPNPIG